MYLYSDPVARHCTNSAAYLIIIMTQAARIELEFPGQAEWFKKEKKKKKG